VVCDTTNNRLDLKDIFLTLVPKTTLIQFTVSGFTNPPTTSTQSIVVKSVHTYAGSWVIDSSTFSVKFLPGTITITAFTPSDKQIYKSTGNYTLTFKPQHAVKTDYIFVLTVPSAYSLV
jgi:hypothetical protein